MFESLKINISGSQIQSLSTSKIGKLKASIDRKENLIIDTEKGNLSKELKEEVRNKIKEEILLIEQSIAFLEVIEFYISSNINYELSIPEINFLHNSLEYDYK
jgi:hypothetical protein